MSDAKICKMVCILCGTSDATISYFGFPANNSRRSEWLRLCNITCEIPKRAKLCVKHFSPESFTKNLNESKQRRRLKVDAVPSQCLELFKINDDEIVNEESSTPVLPFQYKWCFVCGSVNNSQRSLHRFPKNNDDQNVWLSKCGRQSSAQNKNELRLCDLHFSSDSFIVNPLTKKKYLKPGVVPIDVKEFGSTSQNCMNDEPEVVRAEETLTLHDRQVGLISQNSLNDDFEVAMAEDSMTLMPLPADTLTNLIIETPTEIEIDVEEIPSNFNLSLKDNRSSMQIQSQSTSDNIDTCTLDKACQTEDDLLKSVPVNVCTERNTQPSVVVTPTTSMYHADVVEDHSYISTGAIKNVRKPRYVGDICTPHLATPNRAKKCLEMIKKVIESKNKTITSLARKLRYAEEKLETMNDLIIHLRDTKYMSETASNELLVCYE